MRCVSRAVNKAKEVLDSCNPNAVVPFPFEKVFNKYGNIDVFYGSTTADGISGAILYDTETDRYRILINSDEPEARRNFSLAHELGHYFLHQDKLKEQGENGFVSALYGHDNVLLRKSITIESREVETEANAFAAELLMPQEKMMEVFESADFTIEECARIFHVSVAAMAVRVESLGLLNRGSSN